MCVMLRFRKETTRCLSFAFDFAIGNHTQDDYDCGLCNSKTTESSLVLAILPLYFRE